MIRPAPAHRIEPPRRPAVLRLLLGLPAALSSSVVVLVPALLPAGAIAYSDGPPPAHTGGFGEPTCAACHFPPEETQGALTIEGVPDAYRPGGRYPLTVILEDPGLERGGFELSARTVDGGQAGRLEPVDGRVEVVTGSDVEVQYARHTVEGVRPEGVAAGPGEESGGTAAGGGSRVRWKLLWIAPEPDRQSISGGAPGQPPAVRFHAAANAANYDASEFGDVPYAAEAASSPATEPAAEPRDHSRDGA